MLTETTRHDQPPAGESGVEISFTRYLAAKKSVDDRALNRQVWDALARSVPPASPEAPARILEIGAGIGTMIERILERDLVRYACYTAVDSSAENLSTAYRRLESWAQGRGLVCEPFGRGLCLRGEGMQLQVVFEQADLQDLITRSQEARCWDLLIAHHFLDLVDAPSTLPGLMGLLAPEGMFLATINFDGLSLLEPVCDPDLDEQVMTLYHRTMDERRVDGEPSGDSRTGRRLFQHFKVAGAEVLSAGASDWVVFAGPDGYYGDEAYFLRFILYTIQQALTGHPELDPNAFDGWVRERYTQIDHGELVYISHQLDFLARLAAQEPGG